MNIQICNEVRNEVFEERETVDRWRDCLEVIEQTFKSHPNGVGVHLESVRADALYVLDWRPDEPKRMDGIKVEHVVAVNGNTVEMIGSTTDLATFASLVVGGPFPLI